MLLYVTLIISSVLEIHTNISILIKEKSRMREAPIVICTSKHARHFQTVEEFIKYCEENNLLSTTI
jgi:hypothetical protein